MIWNDEMVEDNQDMVCPAQLVEGEDTTEGAKTAGLSVTPASCE